MEGGGWSSVGISSPERGHPSVKFSRPWTPPFLQHPPPGCRRTPTALEIWTSVFSLQICCLTFWSQKLPEEEAGTDFSSRLPAAHLIGAWTKGQGLGWEAKKEEAFLRSGTQFSGAEGLALPQDGLYYLYCHVGYRGRAPPAGGGLLDHSVTLHSRLYRTGGAYGPGTPELLLEGAETVTPVLDPARTHEYGPLWYTSVGFGGLVQLRRGERVYVNISHPDLVDYRRGKTFFGAVMVG
uniref:Lymphotoxin-beta n=1 Tax=Suricata suricatta TaxID=37032 RepID=A0A673T8P0_SURSU